MSEQDRLKQDMLDLLKLARQEGAYRAVSWVARRIDSDDATFPSSDYIKSVLLEAFLVVERGEMN